MPYSLFPQVEREAMSRASGSLGIGEPGAWAGFGYGTGMYAMKSFADTARAIDLLGSVGPIVHDKLTGGTARQDQYFAEHDEVFNRAVDYWTPKPGEVGAAGQIVGSLAGGLPLVIANPALAVAATQLTAGEDLVRQGVDASVAGTVGAIQGASLAVGIRLPFLGKSLVSRMATGAGGNVVQGATGAALSHAVLDAAGNKIQAEQFNPWDPTQRSLDVLMGIAFGGLAHLDAKAQIARRDLLQQSAKDAILTLNQAKHLETVATPGAPEMPEHLTLRVNAMQQAIDQVLRGEPVTADRLTSDLKVTADPAKTDWNVRAAEEMSRQAKSILNDVVLRNEALQAARETPGFQRTAEQLLALKDGEPEPSGTPEVARAIEIANKPGFQRTAEEKLYLDSVLQGKAFDHLLTPIERASITERGPQSMLQLDQSHPVVKAMGELRRTPGSDLAKAASAEFVGKPIVNSDTGITATVSGETLRKMMSKSGVVGSVSSQAHMTAVGNIDKLFPIALPRGEPRGSNKAPETIGAMRHFDAPMLFDGDVLRVKILAKEFRDKKLGTRLYHIQAVEIGEPASSEGITASPELPTTLTSVSPAGSMDRFSQLASSVKRFFQPNAQEAPGATTPEVGASVPPEGRSPDGAHKAQGAEPKTVDPVVDTANRIATERPDMLIPTGELDANGNAVTMSAADYMANAAETARLTQTDAGLFRTAITCMLGML